MPIQRRPARPSEFCARGERPIEQLESRLLLSIAPLALAGDGEPQSKQSQEATHASPDLLQLYVDHSGGESLEQAAARTQLRVDDQQRVSVTVRATHVNVVVKKLRPLGFELTAALPKLHFAEGKLPVASIPSLAKVGPGVGRYFVQETDAYITSAGSVTSQGDNVQEADRVRATLPGGFTGTGQRIGVLSNSYNMDGHAAAGIASGDLPAAGVTVLQDSTASIGDEGRAMLEVVHDVAPDASLVFDTSIAGGQADFAAAVRNMADPARGNATVLVDDTLYYDEPMFQEGVIAQAIDDVVTKRGVSYFSAAGNDASQGYESTTFQTATDTLYLNGNTSMPVTGTYYDFDPGPGVDTRQHITVPAGSTLRIVLQWDDPFYTTSGVDTDLDLYLANPDGSIFRAAPTNNLQSQAPYEDLFFDNFAGQTRSFDIAIRKSAGPNPGRIKYVMYSDYSDAQTTIDQFATNSPTVTPHAAAANAEGVAAAPYYNQLRPEPQTSRGGATILFSSTGVPIAPQARLAPQITAIDDVNTSFFGGPDIEGDGFPNFAGTSAAAAHAAGVAALVRQANPTFTSGQVYQRLQNTAEDISAGGAGVGFDTLTGYGLINAFDAVYPTIVPAALPFSDGFESGALSSAYETRSNGAGRIQVTGANGPFSGTKHLTLDASITLANPDNLAVNQFSLNEVTLHVNAGGSGTKTLSFRQEEFIDEDHAMPATFTGSSNSDGVAISVDGVNWFRVLSLTGAASTSTYSLQTADLSAVAAANGFTLTSDTRIRFQQYDDYPITPGNGFASDGFAFDDVAVSVSAATPALLSTTVGDGTTQRSQVKQLSFTFNGPVSLAAGALKLEQLNTGNSGLNNGGAPTNASAVLGTPTTPDGGVTWIYPFVGGNPFMQVSGTTATGSLIDGIYALTLDHTKVAAGAVTMAADATLTFHRLFGDQDGNRTTNNGDYARFRSAFLKTTGQAGFDPAFDFDGNGAVNNLDYSQFRSRFLKVFSY